MFVVSTSLQIGTIRQISKVKQNQIGANYSKLEYKNKCQIFGCTANISSNIKYWAHLVHKKWRLKMSPSPLQKCVLTILQQTIDIVSIQEREASSPLDIIIITMHQFSSIFDMVICTPGIWFLKSCSSSVFLIISKDEWTNGGGKLVLVNCVVPLVR